MADIYETPERKPIICAHITNPKDMADMFLSLDRLRDSNYARRWHDFPTTKEEMQDTLKIIRIDGEKHGEYYINDYESSIPGLAERLPVGADIDELNFLSVKLAGMVEWQREVFGAVMLSGRHCGSVMDIISVTENIDLFNVQPAYNVEQYGEFLLDMYKNEYAEVFKSLETSDYPEEYSFARYIERLETHVDPAAFGRAIAEEENGVFTDCGYLSEKDAIKELYKELTGVPPEYRVSIPPARPAGLYKMENADITDFVYKLHALAGDYVNTAPGNIKALTQDGAADYCVIMNDAHIRVESAANAYRDGTDINAVFRSFPHDTRSYLLHVDRSENGRAFGTAVMVDCGALSENIAANTPLSRVDVETANVHRAAFFQRCAGGAEAIEPAALLGLLNREYMARAENPQPDMFRVPLQTAKDMILGSDAPVYRLMPGGPQKLTPKDVVLGGLLYQSYREFAVKQEDKAGLDSWSEKKTAAIMGRRPERDAPGKPKKSHDVEL